MALKNILIIKFKVLGVIYFSDGSVNIIEGADEREKYIDTVSTKSSLESVINNAIELSKHPYLKLKLILLLKTFIT